MRALESLSLSVEAGELLAVVGPSGSGKSTVLRLIAGLEQTEGGTIGIAGVDATDMDAPDRGVSMVFQSFALFPHMTVARNIGFGLEARRVPRPEIDRAVQEAADWLGLSELLDRRPSELSGGERQRVALARGLVRRPRVLLMDEPLSNLDAKLRTQTRAEIKRLQREAGITIVYVTHDQAEALALGDRVAILSEGVLQQHGPPQEVYDRPANTFVAGFLGNPPMNLVRGEVEDGVLRSGSVHLPLPDESGQPRGTSLIAGFRAEHATLGPKSDDGFPGVLELAETVGHDRIWHVTAGDERLAVRPPAGFTASEGETIGLSVHKAGVRLFDPETGEAL